MFLMFVIINIKIRKDLKELNLFLNTFPKDTYIILNNFYKDILLKISDNLPTGRFLKVEIFDATNPIHVKLLEERKRLACR